VNKKAIIIAAGALLFLIAVITIAALLSRPKATLPNQTVMTPEEKLKFMASDKFKALSDQQKAQFVQQSMRKGNPGEMFRAGRDLPEAEREKLHENMRGTMETMMKKRVDDYFALPEDQRDAYLDSIVNEMAARRNRMAASGQRPPGPGGAQAQPGQRGPGGPGGPGGWGGDNGLQRLKDRLATTDPTTRAKQTEFRKAFFNKMKQKFGNNFPGPHRPH